MRAPRRRLAQAIGSLALLAAIAALPGCVARVGPPLVGGYATFYASNVPPDVYSYPHVWYEGGYAYLVGDQWFYPSSGGWVVFRTEPRDLYRYRSTYRYPGYPGYGRTYRQAAPPAYAPLPPPATRVR
jgi:hypothetical protein